MCRYVALRHYRCAKLFSETQRSRVTEVKEVSVEVSVGVSVAVCVALSVALSV